MWAWDKILLFVDSGVIIKPAYQDNTEQYKSTSPHNFRTSAKNQQRGKKGMNKYVKSIE